MFFQLIEKAFSFREIKEYCPTKPSEPYIDISQSDFNFNKGDQIYGCGQTLNTKGIRATECNLVIYSCTFQLSQMINNEGGAIYISIPDLAQVVSKQNIIENCDFIECRSSQKGGAIYISSEYTLSNFNIIFCNFEESVSFNQGKSIYFSAVNGTIQYCTFLTTTYSSLSVYGSSIYFYFSHAAHNTNLITVQNNEFN